MCLHFDRGSASYKLRTKEKGLWKSSREPTAFGVRPYLGQHKVLPRLEQGMNTIVLNCKRIWRLKNMYGCLLPRETISPPSKSCA